MITKAWIFLISVVLAGTWVAALKADPPAHPLLLFTGGDLPAIRARIEQPPYAPVWPAQLAKARGLLRSAEVVAPAAPRDWGQDNPRRATMLIGHRIGRDLSDWMETLRIAYHVTRDEAFADKAAALLVTAARRFPVSQEWMQRGFAGGRGDFMRGLALGHDLLNDRLTPEDRALLRVAAEGYLADFLAEAQEPKTWWYGVHTYRVWARVAAGGTKPGGSDSFRVHVGNRPRVEWHMPDRRTWTWGSVSHGVQAEPRVFDLPAGPSEVTFATREAEARVDVGALVPVAAEAPTDDRLPALLGRASEARVEAPMVCRDAPVAARMVVCLSAASPPDFAVDRYEPGDGRQPAFLPRMRAVVNLAAPLFAAVLAMVPSGVREPAITVNRTDAATTIEVNWAAARDTIHWPHDEQGPVVFERRSQIERNQP